MGHSYAIGIDLGTTHSAVASCTLTGAQDASSILPIPQHTAPGEFGTQALLPSFVYLPHANDRFDAPVVGELAKQRSATIPGRVVSSAKSWLGHPGVDRRQPILPADAPTDVTRMSPVEASSRYLQALREAWDTAHPEAPWSAQDLTLTVPASFDPLARQLTVEAARSAGCDQLTLIEEPQAALYHWLEQQGDDWTEQLSVGDVVLVVDMGGGTTDFSLVDVREQDGSLELHRLAVGDHVLLGGDNVDLALAHLVRQKLERSGTTPDDAQLRALAQACRRGKEAILSDSNLTSVPIAIASRGAKLVGSVLQSELTRSEVEAVLLHGFFADRQISSRPSLTPAGAPRSAVTTLGLPYAKDPAVLGHLAHFLVSHAGSVQQSNGGRSATASTNTGIEFVVPTAVLFNGGVFKAEVLRSRVSAAINSWLDEVGRPPARVLAGADYDLACAKGAAAFGRVRRQGGFRIRGGSARSFYLGVESPMPAIPGFEPPLTLLCLAPKGLETGSEQIRLTKEFALVLGEPVHFRFFSSTVREHDAPGDSLDLAAVRGAQANQVQEHAPLRITLPPGDRDPGSMVAVQLSIELTETGTLELFAHSAHGSDRWKVSLDVESNAPQQAAADS